jgi:glyoxalase/bleomycin resistance protein/dioxygenase superfamily protein
LYGTVYPRMDENHHRIALHPSGEMVFLHCNPRHHSIAFQPSIKDLPRSRDKKMWHFMLETNTLDDVGTALDPANRAGVPVVSTLGRHSNNQMVCFYMSTPSGFEIEYGWGGRLVDDAVWQVQWHDRGSLWGHKVQLEPAQTSRCSSSSWSAIGVRIGPTRSFAAIFRMSTARSRC